MLKDIKVIYKDDYLLVVDKPPGLLVVPTPKKEEHTLVNILNSKFSKNENDPKIHPCHRLDRETSGVIIFARGKSTQQNIMEQFHKGRVRKVYTAFVQGRLNSARGVIKIPIEHKFAITHFRRIKIDRRGFSIVEAETLTGRTNQIRIHFKMIGHPLVGERKFAFARDYKIKFRRAALHAGLIQFKHPISNGPLSFRAPLAEDMKLFLEAR